MRRVGVCRKPYNCAMKTSVDLKAGMRIALVGGCGGIGRALAAAVRDSGARIAVLDLPQSILAHPPQAEVVLPVDATDEAQVDAAFARLAADFGALDALVNLAGFSLGARPVAETTNAAWGEVLNGNLNSVFLCCRAALPLLHRGQDAAIVNLASGLGVKPFPGHGPYSVAKAGIIQLTRLLAQENAPRVRVNAVAPGAVDTAFLRGGTGRGGDDPSLEQHVDSSAYLRGVPLGRLAQADDVVGPVLFFLSDAARYVTGQTLHVNGGGLMP